MAGDTGVSISSMEGNLEITCKDGVLKMDAGKNVKINAQQTIDVKAGSDIEMKGSSAKLTSSDNRRCVRVCDSRHVYNGHNGRVSIA